MEVALQPVTNRLVPQHARPAGAQHDRHLARRCVDRPEVDQRLADRLVGLALPVIGLEDVAIGGAPAAAGAARFHAAAVAADHADVEPHQRPHVGGTPAAGADDLDHLPRAGERDRDLARLGLLGAHIGVDLLEQRHLLGEGLAVDRVVVGIEQPVGAARRFVGLDRTAGPHRLDRRRPPASAPARRAPRHARSPSSRPPRRAGRSPAWCRTRRSSACRRRRTGSRSGVLQEELAVVAARQRLVDHLRGLRGSRPPLPKNRPSAVARWLIDLLMESCLLRQTTRTILPKWALAFMCASASAAWASGKVLSIGRLQLARLDGRPQVGAGRLDDGAHLLGAAGAEGDADIVDALQRMQVEVELALHAAQPADIDDAAEDGGGLHVLVDDAGRDLVDDQVDALAAGRFLDLVRPLLDRACRARRRSRIPSAGRGGRRWSRCP